MIVSSIIGFCAAPDRVGRVLCWLWWRGQWRCHRQFASNAAGCQGIDMMRYPSWEPDKSCAILPPPRFIYPLPFYCTALATIINSYMQGVQGNAHHQSTINFVVLQVWTGQPWPQAVQELQPREDLQVVSWYANWWTNKHAMVANGVHGLSVAPSVPIRFREQHWGAWEKKRTLWGKVNNIIKLAVIFCSSSFFSSFPICVLFTLRFWHCILSAARSIWWRNAIWKNNETMSWRDIKLQWLASISCFPFNFQLCDL